MAFGKIWSGMFTGSMMGAGAVPFAVMTYACASADRQDRVELNPKLLSVMIGNPQEEIEEAIEFLLGGDDDSRTKNEDENGNVGVRLIREGEYQYFIPNRKKYTLMKNEAAHARVNRVGSRKYFAKKMAGDAWDEVEWAKNDREKFPNDWLDD